MSVYIYIYILHTYNWYPWGLFFRKDKKYVCTRENNYILSPLQVKLYSCGVHQIAEVHYERIAGINLPLVLWFLRGQDQRPGPIKSIKIKTEVVGGWGGTPREITSSFVVQSTVAKKFTLVRSFLIHYL